MRENSHKLRKLRPVGGRASDLLAEYLFATRRLELGKLAGEVLRPGRDASVAVNHASIVAQNCGTKKRKFFKLLGLLQISSYRRDSTFMHGMYYQRPNELGLREPLRWQKLYRAQLRTGGGGGGGGK